MKIKVNFQNIPTDSKFSFFDKDNSKSNKEVWDVPTGNSSIEFEIPESWTNPYQNIRSKSYWIPNAYIPLDKTKPEITITGGNYYIDINREKIPEELNQESIESLIHSVHNNQAVSARQQFFIALVSLQSYFEYLVYGMLVKSGYKTQVEFNNLYTHENRTNEAFTSSNTHFFSDSIEICPGKGGLGLLIPDPEINNMKEIFETVRKMRNRIVHSWGYKNLSKEDIEAYFAQVGEYINLRTTDDEFYRNAAFVFVRLYAKVNYLKNQLSYFHEKEMIELERNSRGY